METIKGHNNLIHFPENKNEIKHIEVFKVIQIDKFVIDELETEWVVTGYTHDGDEVALGWFDEKDKALNEALDCYTDAITFTFDNKPLSQVPKEDRWNTKGVTT